jgi:hypothetical protein
MNNVLIVYLYCLSQKMEHPARKRSSEKISNLLGSINKVCFYDSMLIILTPENVSPEDKTSTAVRNR